VRDVSARLTALCLLALALVRTLLRRVGGGKHGLAAFRAQYAADALPPVSAEERAQMPAFGRCLACGLCDRGEAERIRASGGSYSGVMVLVLAGSRSMPDFGAAAVGFRCLSSDVLAEKERICPAAVPIRQISDFVVGKAGTGAPL
jgi:hypothetical protein